MIYVIATAVIIIGTLVVLLWLSGGTHRVLEEDLETQRGLYEHVLNQRDHVQDQYDRLFRASILFNLRHNKRLRIWNAERESLMYDRDMLRDEVGHL
jgi:hypothetical protein